MKMCDVEGESVVKLCTILYCKKCNDSNFSLKIKDDLGRRSIIASIGKHCPQQPKLINSNSLTSLRGLLGKLGI